MDLTGLTSCCDGCGTSERVLFDGPRVAMAWDGMSVPAIVTDMITFAAYVWS